MSELIFVTGGGRSGKSSYAQNRVQSYSGLKTFIATCPKIDESMDKRIEKHRMDREGENWHTIEEETDLAKAIRKSNGVVLIDCLTLWINNLLYQAERKAVEVDEAAIAIHCDKVIEAIQKYSFPVFMVSNEVGMGIIPENQLARLFVDLSGRCNQIMAKAADEVVWMVSGIPQIIKKGSS